MVCSNCDDSVDLHQLGNYWLRQILTGVLSQTGNQRTELTGADVRLSLQFPTSLVKPACLPYLSSRVVSCFFFFALFVSDFSWRGTETPCI